MSRERWQKRLWYTGVDNTSRKNMIGVENELVDAHEGYGGDFVDEVLQQHGNRGRVSSEDIIRALVRQLDEFNVDNRDRLQFYLERLHGSGRRRALDRAGLKKKAIRAKIAQTDEERRQEVLRSINMAFQSVTSLPDQIVESIRERMQQGLVSGITTQQVLRQILQEQIDDLDLEQEDDLREALERIWTRTRSDLQRVIRTETVNAYSRVQLQEWHDEGIRQVTRHSIDDDVTCAVCRALSRPPDNVYDIVDLLRLDYPVTQDPRDGSWLTHPNCRCWFEPIIEDVWEELEDLEVELFGDIRRQDTMALSVPIDDRDHVEKMLREMDEDITMQFVARIEDVPEWREWQRNQFITIQGYSPERAEVALDDEIYFGGALEWTDPQTGTSYIARDSRKIDHITMPMARAQGIRKYDKLPSVDFILERFREKKEETEMTLESEGIQIFGGEPFINPAASNSSQDYFTESYAFYMVNPTLLQALDKPMYDWLNADVFHGREYLQRGGIK